MKKNGEDLDVPVQTSERPPEQGVEEGMEAVPNRREHARKVSHKKHEGDAGAHSIASAYIGAPKGYTRWPLPNDEARVGLKRLSP